MTATAKKYLDLLQVAENSRQAAGAQMLVLTTLNAASTAHDRGELSDEDMILVMRAGINATAVINGYADRYGLPCPLDGAP